MKKSISKNLFQNFLHMHNFIIFSITNHFLMKHFVTILSLLFICFHSTAQVTTPKAHFGFNIGDDYHLANFTETESYFKKLAKESNRLKYTVIGKTEEGRDQPMLIVSSPQNLKHLEEYKSIAQRLARAEITTKEALKLAEKGKSIVWIDGGLHSTETVGMHQLIEMAYLLATKQDAETNFILENTIVLLTHANPDGQELISNWYMREKTPENRSLANIPRLYQKYAGHDNNRDFFMLNLKESQNIARQLFIEWNPQIMYNHHQTAPAGAVVAGAPYRDPFNYVFDPLVITGIESLGAAMSSRLYAENKPGYTQRGGSVFSTWYNGGLRTTTYFHNTIGLLTEIIGGPNPFEIPLVPSRLIPNSNTHYPVLPQTWHFKQSIDYSISLNYAVLSYAAKYRQELLFNIYRMGKNSIEKGNKDTWSLSPSKVAVIDSAITKLRKEDKNNYYGRRNPKEALDSLLTNPAYRDPRAYIISNNTHNPATTKRFLDALSANGIRIEQASDGFTFNHKQYPAGSYIIRTNQAFRPHILDMFEAQDHPNDFEYPGGPPIPPYDAAGWTLAYMMHIDFERSYDELPVHTMPLPLGAPINTRRTEVPKSKFVGLSIKENEAFKIVNTLLNQKEKVYKSVAGDFIVLNNPKTKSLLEQSGIQVCAVSRLDKTVSNLKPLKIGLWDTYGGSMPSGWTRFILENYDYNFEVIYALDIDKGNLIEQFDVIILPSNAILSSKNSSEIPSSIPVELHEKWGSLSIENSLPSIEEFVEQGGRLIAIGGSSKIAEQLNLGIKNHLKDINGQALKREVYYTPGSILTAAVNNTAATGAGYPAEIDIYFNNNNVYEISDKTIKPLLWFNSPQVLKSGWSWGEPYLENGIIGFEKVVGKGKVIIFTPDITFRAQSHGTFKFLFNSLYP